MPKQATPVVLSEQEEQGLLQITRRHRSEQQVVLRARIVLAAAQGSSNAQIARELDVCVDTVRLWRDRWAGLQGIDLETLSLAGRLQDAPRPGTTPTFTAEQRCQMAALACEAPAKAGRPISQWTGREIADEMNARGIVEQISPRHAARLLKKGLPTSSVPLLADRGGGFATRRENYRGLSGLCSSSRTSRTRRANHQHG